MVVPLVLTTSDFRYSNQVIATGKLTGSYQIHLDSWHMLLGYGEIMIGILGRELWADLLPEHTSIRGEVYSFLLSDRIQLFIHTHALNMCKSEDYRNCLVLILHHLGHRNWNQVIRSTGKRFNLLHHFTCPF